MNHGVYKNGKGNVFRFTSFTTKGMFSGDHFRSITSALTKCKTDDMLYGPGDEEPYMILPYELL